jgi:hypothetical protein
MSRDIAHLHTRLGENEQAFAWLDKAYEEHDMWLATLKVEPKWDSLRSDPRFQELERRVGLPQSAPGAGKPVVCTRPFCAAGTPETQSLSDSEPDMFLARPWAGAYWG